ncbi:CrcB family protein [Gracilibacillus sp. JCM 18860]|uniref:CrcB family protein n=1 Tax=Gracilibacillus sp. JCM 18860 TaxID=1306159 RepID=UPI0006D1EA7A
MAVYYTIVNKEKVNLLGSQGKNLLAISIGASVGTYCRYSLSIWMNNILFPLGTLVGNIMGSFLLGLFTSIFTRIIPKEWLKLGLGVGFCGGFTTMSTFSAEVAHFFIHNSTIMIIGYVTLSVIGGIGSALLGYLIGNLFWKNSVTEGSEAE